MGSILDEAVGEQVEPVLSRAEELYRRRLGQRPVKMGSLDEQTQGQVKGWLNQVRDDMASTKYAAMSYGQQMRDSALLNYNRRYGMDQVMEIVYPYQFWMTRSMIEWAKRMIDKPSWFAMYARLQKTQERMAANMPSRLRGKVRMPAPWLPEWAGGGLWVDPMQKLLPFSTFGQPFEQFAKDTDQVQRVAGQLLDEQVEAGALHNTRRTRPSRPRAGRYGAG
jgi:hypothetical protein